MAHPNQGSLTDLHLQPFETCCFFNSKSKGKPPFTSCNVQVYDVRISVTLPTQTLLASASNARPRPSIGRPKKPGFGVPKDRIGAFAIFFGGELTDSAQKTSDSEKDP